MAYPASSGRDHVQATWHGAVLAESDRTIKLGGNHYMPAESLHWEFFTDSSANSICPWKGQTRYYDVAVNGPTSRQAAWYYANPSPAARQIAGHVAFWHGARVERSADPAGEPAAIDGFGLRAGRRPGTHAVAAAHSR